MIFDFARFSALATTALLLAACPSRSPLPPATAPQQNWSLITPQHALIERPPQNPMRIDEAISNESDMRTALEKIGDRSNTTTSLGQLIRDIRSDNVNQSVPVPGLTGLGGVLGHAMLNEAETALRGNDTFDPDKQIFVSVSGEIQDYEYNAGQNSGRLEVITHVTTTPVPNNRPGRTIPRTTSYLWTIEVVNNGGGGFRAYQHNGNPSDPFPGTMPFTAEMLALIQARGYQWKLWASGTDIKIVDVQIKRGASQQFTTLSNMPKYTRLFNEISDNCIDMMFIAQPPATLPDHLDPPFYCLGRCANPLIVNTGD